MTRRNFNSASAILVLALSLGSAAARAENYKWSVDSGFWAVGENWTPRTLNGGPGKQDQVSAIVGPANTSLDAGLTEVAVIAGGIDRGKWYISGHESSPSELKVNALVSAVRGSVILKNGGNKGPLTVELGRLELQDGDVYFGTKSNSIGGLLNSLSISDSLLSQNGRVFLNVGPGLEECSLGLVAMSGGQITLNISNGEGVNRVVSINGLEGGGGVIQAQNGSLGAVNSALLILNGDQDHESAAVIQDGPLTGGGALSIQKNGAGVQILTGNLTYSGQTRVSDGSLYVNNTHEGGAAYKIDGKGVLGGGGLIRTKQIVFEKGGRLSPGNKPRAIGVLQLAVEGGVDCSLVSDAAFDFDLKKPSQSDQVKLLSGRLNVGDLAFNKFRFTANPGFGPGKFVLFEATSEIEGRVINASGGIGAYTGSLAIEKNKIILTVTR